MAPPTAPDSALRAQRLTQALATLTREGDPGQLSMPHDLAVCLRALSTLNPTDQSDVVTHRFFAFHDMPRDCGLGSSLLTAALVEQNAELNAAWWHTLRVYVENALEPWQGAAGRDLREAWHLSFQNFRTSAGVGRTHAQNLDRFFECHAGKPEAAQAALDLLSNDTNLTAIVEPWQAERVRRRLERALGVAPAVTERAKPRL